MSTTKFRFPPQTRISEVCRNLPAGLIHAIDTVRVPADGDLVLIELAPGASRGSIRLAHGRVASIYAGDPVLAVAARYQTPLAPSCEAPISIGAADLVSSSGIVGLRSQSDTVSGAVHPVRIIGVAVDVLGEPVNLSRLAPASAAADRPLSSLAVVSAARGTRASQVTESLIDGLCRTGLLTGTAKPFGMVDGRERWKLLDTGAQLALDPVDAGQLDTSALSAESLLVRTRGMLSVLAEAGCQASVLRIGGGLGSAEATRLLAHPGFRGLVDGVVLAASDAMSATEGVQWLSALGLPVVAVSGGLCRSPLASREAAAAIDLPVLHFAELAQPAQLTRLLSHSFRTSAASESTAPQLALAA